MRGQSSSPQSLSRSQHKPRSCLINKNAPSNHEKIHSATPSGNISAQQLSAQQSSKLAGSRALGKVEVFCDESVVGNLSTSLNGGGPFKQELVNKGKTNQIERKVEKKRPKAPKPVKEDVCIQGKKQKIAMF